MAWYFNENVHTRTFTPKEFQVELLDAAKERNIIVCLENDSNKSFIVLKLIQELSTFIRLRWSPEGIQKSVFVGTPLAVKKYAHILRCLTDLRVAEFLFPDVEINFNRYQVLCLTYEVCLSWIKSGLLNWSLVNLLVLDECHHVIKDHPAREIVLNLKECPRPPRILGLTEPLFISSGDPACVEAEIKRIQLDLNASAESASDIVSILRYNAHPKEFIVEYSSLQWNSLSEEIALKIRGLKSFLDDHRYDPSEIYWQEEFAEEIKKMPDPKKDPYDIIEDFLYILETMGPWCADKAALLLLLHIEKLKVKTPYERHYLLLCLVSSVLLSIRVICDHYFEEFSEQERIYKFSSPKILRLIEVIRQFKPKKAPECINSPEMNADSRLCGSGTSHYLSHTSVSPSSFPEELLLALAETHKNKSLDLATQKAVYQALLKLNPGLKIPKHLLDDFSELATVNGECKSNEDSDYSSLKDNQHSDGTEDTKPKNLESVEDVHPENNVSDENTLDKEKFPPSPIKFEVSDEENEEFYDAFEEIPPEMLEEDEWFDCYEDLSQIQESMKFQKFGEDWLSCNCENDNTPDKNQFKFGGRLAKWRSRNRNWKQGKRPALPKRHFPSDDADSLCGIIFVNKRFTAKVLFHLLNDLRKCDPDFELIITQYTVEKVADPLLSPREAEIEHRKQEDVLKRFRMRECNLVIATGVLEEGIELPKCNLIVRYDPAESYRSHANSKARAKQISSNYIFMVEDQQESVWVQKYAQYMHIEGVLLSFCANLEPSEEEEKEADLYNNAISPYFPCETDTSILVNMNSSIALVNKYCAKLPSDTFTRLSPLWNVKSAKYLNKDVFVCSVRLPINSPVKKEIMGHPMPSRALARRVTALEVCRVLHSSGELDDRLEPVGKEAFNALLEEEFEEEDPSMFDPNLPRPGTTKSRHYYYKKIASCLNDCRPEEGVECKLYHIEMTLTCPLPEEQNTRGRKLHPPELATQSFGILTTKLIPQICPFPIFTRSGEVCVNLKLIDECVIPSERQIETMAAFLHFIFTSVLRLQKYLMKFVKDAKKNSFFIVPITKDDEGNKQVDWNFLNLIYERKEEELKYIPNEERQTFKFDPALYSDAVVMPWYRNQDQPQYFYVAEICHQLNAKSRFPGSSYHTFEDYYSKKYNIQIQNLSQPLLDVDHTSARLNFLTPRYVNRKGVALPTSSEETKRAKRENLEQKQILVAELCKVHVIPASLWRQAVCLPCILYRVNALLLADEIRTTVAQATGLGLTQLPSEFVWPSLDFGWSLADVLKKSREACGKKDTEVKEIDSSTEISNELAIVEITKTEVENKDETELSKSSDKDKDSGEDEGVACESEEEKGDNWIEIGTWSNDMVQLEDLMNADGTYSKSNYGEGGWGGGDGHGNAFYFSDADTDDSSSLDDVSVKSNRSYNATSFKIKYRGNYLAEAEDAVEDSGGSSTNGLDERSPDELEGLEIKAVESSISLTPSEPWEWSEDNVIEDLKDEIAAERLKFNEATSVNVESIKKNNLLINTEKSFVTENLVPNVPDEVEPEKKELPFQVECYGLPADSNIVKDLNNVQFDLNQTDSGFLDVMEDESDDFCDPKFSFDYQPELEGHPGPSPSLILQALTMSNANDGINLERLETIGDSFLKYAITTYLYCTYDKIHEGKLSHLRSKQVSNLNLYRLGRKKLFGESMIATKFEPHDNWLPPCYMVPRESEQALIGMDLISILPYNLVTQHSIPDKSIADCVEALIGAYLIACGPRGALIFMSWLGIKVLPKEIIKFDDVEIEIPEVKQVIGSTPVIEGEQIIYGEVAGPNSPLVRHIADPEGELTLLLAGFDTLEANLRYSFNDRAYLLQAMSHASYSTNRLTDCYQRLEFLGDAVLDYLITRHLYEDQRAHSPGALTDLRSALVNNTIFASLAVRHGLHKYFRHLSPALGDVVQRFVTIQEANSHTISEEYYLVGEEAEDVEVPKALGDIFESIAGAIYLDSNMSLDTVWRVYYRMMKSEIDQFSSKVPKSPIRELLELEPETAKFGKPKKLADGRRVRVTVEIFGKGVFKGIGRNYRIAKCTAAKCALKHLKKESYMNNIEDSRTQQLSDLMNLIFQK